MGDVTIYTKSGCPHCFRAKRRLTRLGLDFDEVSMDDASADKRQELVQRFGSASMPQILIAGRHIGGADELAAMETSGQLQSLLKGQALQVEERYEAEHPCFARYWRLASQVSDHGAQREWRLRLLQGLHGTVVELGAGAGTNFAHYPARVSQVVAIEPEPHLRLEAERASEQAPVNVRVVDGVAEALPLEDDLADAVVSRLVLCSVASPSIALRELRRVLKPDGELRFFEHVVSRRPYARKLQAWCDATFWPRTAGGCHMSRDTLGAIAAADFKISEHRRVPRSGLDLPLTHVMGVALPAPFPDALAADAGQAAECRAEDKGELHG